MIDSPADLVLCDHTVPIDRESAYKSFVLICTGLRFKIKLNRIAGTCGIVILVGEYLIECIVLHTWHTLVILAGIANSCTRG